MVPYVSYLKALQEHSEALNSNMSGNCLTPVEENKIIIIRNILTNVTNSFQDWVRYLFIYGMINKVNDNSSISHTFYVDRHQTMRVCSLRLHAAKLSDSYAHAS